MPVAHPDRKPAESVDGQVQLAQVALDRDLAGGRGLMAKLDADELDVGAEDGECRADLVVSMFKVVTLTWSGAMIVGGGWLAHGL